MIEGKISFLLQVQCLIGLLLFVLKAGRQKIYSNELDAHARISEKKTNRVEDFANCICFENFFTARAEAELTKTDVVCVLKKHRGSLVAMARKKREACFCLTFLIPLV